MNMQKKYLFNTKTRAALLTLSITILISACSMDNSLHALNYTRAADLQPIKNSDLRNMMQQLETVIYTYKKSDDEQKNLQTSKQLTSTISAISLKIIAFKNTEEAYKLTGIKGDLYEKYSLELNQKSNALSTEVEKIPRQDITPQLNEIINTCNDCHALFRTM